MHHKLTLIDILHRSTTLSFELFRSCTDRRLLRDSSAYNYNITHFFPPVFCSCTIVHGICPFLIVFIVNDILYSFCTSLFFGTIVGLFIFLKRSLRLLALLSSKKKLCLCA